MPLTIARVFWAAFERYCAWLDRVFDRLYERQGIDRGEDDGSFEDAITW